MAYKCIVCGASMEEPNLITVYRGKNAVLCSINCLKQLIYRKKGEIIIGK